MIIVAKRIHNNSIIAIYRELFENDAVAKMNCLGIPKNVMVSAVSSFHLPSRCCSLSVTLLLLLSILWRVPIHVKVHFDHLLSSKNGKKHK